ncbi:MAG: thioredoxin family protein, partial [Sphingomonadales bacterium]|nr:thioredoxin family protein [Sphingomonadales bacterium]
NLMPCVFPVLSLKALALVRLSEHTPGAARADGLAYTAGVVSSFLVVAAALIAVKGAGEAVGWGFQLQSPVFVLAMALILFAVGLSFTGLFSLGTVFAGLGQGLAERKGPAGSFFTGVLATLVATPCTAPFMAPALGFALTQPALLGLVIFAALGFGLALPYLLISFLPPVARLLPKPGAWMETFQQFLAFPMFLTVIWLVWVLGRQTGATVSALALVGMVALAFAIWAWRRVGGLTGRGLAIAASGAWLILAAQFLAPMTPDPASSQAEIAYEAYSEARVAELRAAETPIFVNFTADWCITCLVNERVALSTPEVVEFFRSRNIHALKADWTNRSPEIAGKLAEFGRSGIPLYLFYAPLSPEPLILPQVLTPGMVVEKIDESLTIKLAEERGGS